MKTIYIRTERLDLIPATLEILESDRDDRQKLARLLSAAVPGSWPPPLLDDETLGAFIQMVSEKGDPLFAAWYWVRDDPRDGERVLVGSGGVASSPVPGTVLIGYSVLEEFQCRGYATEAVRHLIPAIFSLPGVRRIVATTYPDLFGSIRVLEKNGFVHAGEAPAGEGFEEGTVVYVREKPEAPFRS
ncbi:GNAT family N-acetyltransferase [Methanoculleus oceani]|uniref:N-acetyltransferase n=1 Tax=Methanoculleus oceani TaxID=2184756 RepID=A0ABD4TC26_9EURY|nr:GNAT family N-acetyltransferase [Methanoculleus sp. CWC-02]MCM2466257.1 N-acetyltransferase [Methanoculleus sp. CWC-02]